MKRDYQWHGEPVMVEFGLCTGGLVKDKPLWWTNYECSFSPGKSGFAIEAVKVIYGKEEFVISNQYGRGVHKLLNGGWPNLGHGSLPMDGFMKDDDFAIYEYDEDAFQEYEAKREQWQKKNFPEDYKKIQSLKAMIKR